MLYKCGKISLEDTIGTKPKEKIFINMYECLLSPQFIHTH